MASSIDIPNTITIARGGLTTREVLSLLSDKYHILHPDKYHRCNTVTLVVGTNDIEPRDPPQGWDTLELLHEFDQLVTDLMHLFPQARFAEP